MNDKKKMLIKEALIEDGYLNDVTTKALITTKNELTGRFIAKSPGVLSGMEVAKMVFEIVNPKIAFEITRASGSKVNRGDVIALVKGPIQDILRGERVALNFMQRLSGIATTTAKYVSETYGTKCQILDTRKTTPLLRLFEKEAVVHGGGTNHRYNLSDRVLIKDNHIAAVGSVTEAVLKAKEEVKNDLLIEVEVENRNEFVEALNTPCDIIMLDNMSNELMSELVKLNNGIKKLEASGNMTLSRIRSVSLLGVDYISVGALTHSYKSLDISLRFFKKSLI